MTPEGWIETVKSSNGSMACPACQKGIDKNTLPHGQGYFSVFISAIAIEGRYEEEWIEYRWIKRPVYYYKYKGECCICCLHWEYDEAYSWPSRMGYLWYEKPRNDFDLQRPLGEYRPSYYIDPELRYRGYGEKHGQEDIIPMARWI